MRGKQFLLAVLLLGALVPAIPAQAATRGFRTRVFIGGGWGWGWGGWGWGGWGWGYPAYYPAYGYPGYGYGYGPTVFARVKTDVDPEEARLYLDGRLIGTADDFDGYPDFLYLKRGHYRLEFRLDGYEPKTIEVNAEPGVTLRIDNKLKKIPGAKHGSYDEPKIEGGIQRFWGKRRDLATPMHSVQPGADIGDDEYSVSPNSRDGNGEPERAPAEGWRGSHPRSSDARKYPSGSAEKSRLSLAVSPADAAVYVDDRFVGTAEEVGSLASGLAVAPGKHTVTVSRPGFQDRFVDLEIEAGGAQKVEISLKRQ
jgi:hypothetical protein